jgi:hypothetical protein
LFNFSLRNKHCKGLKEVSTLVPYFQTLGDKHSTMGSEKNRIGKEHLEVVGQAFIVS